jgi:hypothetical protein
MTFKPSSIRKFFFTYICPRFYGGSPPSAPSNTTSTVTQNSIPAELMPYATGMLSAASNQLYTKDASGGITGYQPYKPYSTNAQDYVAPFSSMQQQAQTSAAGLQTPGQFAPATQMAGLSGAGSMMAGQNYQNQATDPNSISAYMSPYMQNVVQQQQREANRTYDISGVAQQGAATQAGAFGGSREALMAAENERNRNMQLANIQATGTQNAFQNAQQAQQFGATTGLAGYGQGIQGAQAMGQLGTAQLAAQQGVIGTQSTMGGQQQAQNQAAIDQAVLNYQNEQQQPYLAAGTMNSLIRGTPTGNLTTQNYQAQPSALTQIGGALGTAGSLYGAATAKAKGGIIQAYAGGGSIEGNIESQLQDMDDNQLQQIMNSSPSESIKGIAKRILAEHAVEGRANGGIIGYANGGVGQLSWQDQLEATQQEMKAKAYKAHGWTDQDISEYKSSGRVPLDPKKQIALRDVEPTTKMPESKSSYYDELQAKSRRVPESEVIRLRDQNTQQPRSQTSPRIEPDRGITQYRPEASAYEQSRFGGNLESPAIEGAYLGGQPSAEQARLSNTMQQEPISGEKGNLKYGEFTEKEYATRMKERADAMKGNQRIKSKEGLAYKAGQHTDKGGPYESTISGDKRLSTVKQGVRGGPQSFEEGSSQFTGEGIKKVGRIGGKALGLAGAGLYAAETFSEPSVLDTFLANRAKAGDPQAQQVMASGGTNPIMESLKQPVREQLNKLDPSAAWDYLKNQFTQPTQVTVDNTLPTSILEKQLPNSSATPQSPTANAQELPVQKGIDTPVPESNLNAELGAREVNKGIQGAGMTGNVESNAAPEPQQGVPVQSSGIASLQAEYDAADKEDAATAAKSVQDIMAEETAKRKEAGIETSQEASATERKQIMDERANAGVEQKRQMYLRMGEFFANWGSTPGAPLAAGLKAMKETLPGVMDDSKAHIKLMRDINKSENDLNHAVRLEQMGLFDKASLIKEKASDRILQHKEAVAGLAIKEQIRQETFAQQKELEAMQQGGANYRTEATVAATEGGSESKSQTWKINHRNSLIQEMNGIGSARPTPARVRAIQNQIIAIDKELNAGEGSSLAHDFSAADEIIKGVK